LKVPYFLSKNYKLQVVVVEFSLTVFRFSLTDFSVLGFLLFFYCKGTAFLGVAQIMKAKPYIFKGYFSG